MIKDEKDRNVVCFVELTEYAVKKDNVQAYEIRTGGDMNSICNALAATVGHLCATYVETNKIVDFLKEFTMKALHSIPDIVDLDEPKEFYKLLKKLTETEEEE